HLWFELTNRRRGERTVSYAESHDQALVGDQTLMFRLAGSAMYDHMTVSDPHPGIDRALALHKLIRLITLASADKGYLTFMGNEFGHPDWIDFPREGNDWSCAYARRQWSLVDDPLLKYRYLALFDADMIALVNNTDLLLAPQSSLLHEHSEDKVIAFERAGLVFAFNFHPTRSYESYRLQAPPGKYHIILDSDASKYGGHGRVDGAVEHFAAFMVNHPRGNHELSLYLPTRTALVLARA
ncbi:MAG: alpha amylase C-terminal domain-containing protein, partial [Deltaproteobacteria bacterium]|nr:alpha amylase C-terminal domain-containing protein [Deltaproteobacteria bacterium]